MNLSKAALFLISVFVLCACSSGFAGGPQLGMPGKGPVIDKTGDQVLQSMIAELEPKFRAHEFSSGSSTLKYSLYTPENMKPDTKYPLVLFMADASTAGGTIQQPLMQGYGALVWATPASQAKNPCFVLVPQFSGVAVNDAYDRTPEVDMVMELVQELVKEKNIDPARLYTTGQSMGGMISMYLDIAYPQVFAASLFVDCHWNPDQFQKLVEQKFIFVNAGTHGKSWAAVEAIEEAARKYGRSYTAASWSARLPQKTQDELAQTMLEKGAPINLFTFEDGTVLPEDNKGSEHMYSFDYAYKLTPVREWLFKQVK